MPQIAYADESGIDDKSRCYGIGVITTSIETAPALNYELMRLYDIHKIQGELKWTRIRKNHGTINFLLDVVALILQSPNLTFDAIIVNKNMYRNWQGDVTQRATAFYQTYTQLLRHIVRRSKDTTTVYIDQRSDSYPKHHEVVQTIGNRMLAQLHSHGNLQSVSPVDSSTTLGIQAADLLTGAITASCCRYLQESYQMHPGKSLAIKRVAQMLGWDDLCYDTYPHPKFNIWHFPIEYRGIPKKMNPKPIVRIPYVNISDFDDC